MFTQQTIKVVADHELDTWDYGFKDLTATVQFKSMKLSFLHIDLQACKEFQAQLMEARKIFGTARIPADNLINALIDAGYKLVKTEVNRPSTPVTIRDPWQSGPIAMLNTPKLVSELHNVPCGGTLASNQSYRVGEASMVDEWPAASNSVAPADVGVSREGSRSVYTINLSTPLANGKAFADAVSKAFEAIDADKARGR